MLRRLAAFVRNGTNFPYTYSVARRRHSYTPLSFCQEDGGGWGEGGQTERNKEDGHNQAARRL